MDANVIDTLSTLDPISKAPTITHAEAQHQKMSPLHAITAKRLLSKYTKPNFGYYIALQFANHRMKFPIPLMQRDFWVIKAYMMFLDPWRNYNKHVAEAYHIARQTRQLPELAGQLHALLLSYDTRKTHAEHIADVARRTGIDFHVVDAFEILFFNVLDRAADSAYLSQKIYPKSRVVEFDENYLRNSSNSDILLRVAFNHKDMDMTAYLSGLGDRTYLRKIAASENREAELTKFIMGNGLMLTHTNLLNQKSVGMGRAATLLAASRQGGQTAEEPPLGGVAPLWNTAFKAAVTMNQEQVMQQMQDDEGMLLDHDPE